MAAIATAVLQCTSDRDTCRHGGGDVSTLSTGLVAPFAPTVKPSASAEVTIVPTRARFERDGGCTSRATDGDVGEGTSPDVNRASAWSSRG